MLLLVLVASVSTVCGEWTSASHHDGVRHSIGDKGVPSFDCAMRKFAYEYGQELIPRAKGFASLYYALNLNDPECFVRPPAEDVPAHVSWSESSSASALADEAVFVHPQGDDSNAGTLHAPLRSIHLAVERALVAKVSTVVLRGGTYFLSDTLFLGPQHSGLTIRPYPGEEAVVSGGTLLTNLTWTPYKVDVSTGLNIWVANIRRQVRQVAGLQIDGKRATRARFPNIPGGIEVSCGYGCMIPGDQAVWTPPNFTRFDPVKYFTDMDPAHDRNDTANDWFKHYMVGIGGLCSVYDPPVGYWCSEHPSGGGAFAFRTPSGVAPNDGVLPNSPYADTSQMIVNVWRPARWENWMFEVGHYNRTTNNFTFGYGGFQGARGNDVGGDFFVENVMEELDYPGEFFFNNKTGDLYLFYNGTGAPPANASMVVPLQQVLVNISGTQWAPVRNVQLQGIKYTATAYTYMNPHGVPSAGDWALERFAAVYLYGTEGTLVDGCTFERLDGNGVMLSGYNRHVSVQYNDFAFLGGNAIAAWGFTNETATDPARPNIVLDNWPQAGVDGTDGEHPRYTSVLGNTAREVGLYEKQSSFYVQAKTAETSIIGNVFFNGPRAGINFNDGFGGGDEIAHNLVFSTCRESGDHGPLNSWDRQPYLTSVRDGTPSMDMKPREIHHNFFIDNYSPQENVDNDDGSAYYFTHHNFLVFGGLGMKNDFGGHDNHHYDNVYAYAGAALRVTEALDGHEDFFYNNRAVLTGSNVGSPSCTAPGKTVMYNNSYFTAMTGLLTECGMAFTAWQQQGNEVGSTVETLPDDATIIEWARSLLL